MLKMQEKRSATSEAKEVGKPIDINEYFKAKIVNET